MQTIKIEGIDEYVYEGICENGLRVYVWVQEKANSFKGTLTYLCGAEDIHFKKGDEEIHVPMGVAHYLEHIMCKDEENVSLLSKFQKIMLILMLPLILTEPFMNLLVLTI